MANSPAMAARPTDIHTSVLVKLLFDLMAHPVKVDQTVQMLAIASIVKTTVIGQCSVVADYFDEQEQTSIAWALRGYLEPPKTSDEKPNPLIIIAALGSLLDHTCSRSNFWCFPSGHPGVTGQIGPTGPTGPQGPSGVTGPSRLTPIPTSRTEPNDQLFAVVDGTVIDVFAGGQSVTTRLDMALGIPGSFVSGTFVGRMTEPMRQYLLQHENALPDLILVRSSPRLRARIHPTDYSFQRIRISPENWEIYFRGIIESVT